MKFEYSRDKMALKILKNAKRRDVIKNIIAALLAICYIFVIIDVVNENKNIFATTIFFVLVCLVLTFIIRKNNIKHLLEVIDLNYPEGFLNLSICSYEFFTKSAISKRIPSAINEKSIITSLCNIATAYFQMGDIENVMKVVTYLETQYNVKNKKVDNFKKLIISNIKAAIAYDNNDITEFEEQNIKLREVLETLPEKTRYNFLIKLNLRKALLENNIDEVNKLCDELNKSKRISDKVSSAYVRAQILEKNAIEGWKDYYKYVADNGNTLAIAKKAREKLGIKDFEIKNIKFKKYIGYKIFITLFSFLLVATCSFYIDYTYEKSKISWDTGEVAILNNNITLPCKISDFEKQLGIKIDTSKISSLGHYELRLTEDSTQINSNIRIDEYKKIDLMINDGYITGIDIDISNSWNKQLDRELGKMVTFPQEITVNDTLEKIKNTYKTGLLNVFARDWDETIESYDGDIYSYGISYKGNHYGINIKAINGEVKSIFYYYSE